MTETTTAMPRDKDSNPIPVLSPVDATTAVYNLTSGGGLVTQNLPAGAQIIEIAATANVQCAFGGTAAQATSKCLPGGMAVYAVPANTTQLSAIVVSGVSAAVVTVTKLA